MRNHLTFITLFVVEPEFKAHNNRKCLYESLLLSYSFLFLDPEVLTLLEVS